MGIEIERKYLVADDGWKTAAGEGVVCKQGYLTAESDVTVRVRIMGDKAFLTIKGATQGVSRPEYEYEIPLVDGVELLGLCGPLVEKTRYRIRHDSDVWALDVFSGANTGLIMAEIELESEEQEFDHPVWAGKEVSDDPRYRNAYLAQHPYSKW